MDGLFLLAQVTGFIAPQGADPTADLMGWKQTIDGGEPYGGGARSIAREFARYHGSAGLSGAGAPLLAQNGWRDELFPAAQALRAYSALRRLEGARVALQLGDVGHSPGSNKAGTDRLFNDQSARWFDALLKGSGRPLANGTVTALFGNAYAFARGHRAKLELVGRDAGYLRTANGRFSVRVTRLSASLPTRQRKPR